jgi:hypothetical protein
MVISCKPGSFPDKQKTIWHTFNLPKGVALVQIKPHIQNNGTIGLEHLPMVLQLLEAAFENPDRVATAEQKIRDTEQMRLELSQNYAESQLFATHLQWITVVLNDILRIRLPQEIKDIFQYNDIGWKDPCIWGYVSKVRQRDSTISGSESLTEDRRRNTLHLLHKVIDTSKRSGHSLCWECCQIIKTHSNGPQFRPTVKLNESIRKEEFCWGMPELRRDQPLGGGIHVKEKGSDV